MLQAGESPKHQPVETSKPVAVLAAAPAASSGEVQLKYENDRLKLALAHR